MTNVAGIPLLPWLEPIGPPAAAAAACPHAFPPAASAEPVNAQPPTDTRPPKTRTAHVSIDGASKLATT